MIITKHIKNWKKEVRLKRTQRLRQTIKDRGLEVDDDTILMIIHQDDIYEGIQTAMWLFLMILLMNTLLFLCMIATITIP